MASSCTYLSRLEKEQQGVKLREERLRERNIEGGRDGAEESCDDPSAAKARLGPAPSSIHLCFRQDSYSD